MAPTAEIQRWSAAAVDWGANATSTGLSYALNQKLRDWIAVVNGNAANVNKQIEMWKDETSSTSSFYQGMVLKVYYDSGVDDNFYWGIYGTNTLIDTRAGKVWLDNGSNGGYGTYNSAGGYFYSDNQAKRLDGSLDASMYIAYDTTNDQEFFSWCVTDDVPSNTYQDTNTILKASNGQWFCMSNDASNLKAITYSNSLADVNSNESGVLTSSNISMVQNWTGSSFRVVRFGVVPLTTSADPPALIPITYAKNPFIGSLASGANSGNYYIYDQGNPNETLIVCNGYFAPFISLGPIDFVNG